MRTSQLPQKMGDGVSQPEHCGVQWLFLLQAVSPHEAKAEAGTVVSDVPAERESATITTIQIILFILCSTPQCAAVAPLHSEPPTAAFAGARWTRATIVRSIIVVKSRHRRRRQHDADLAARSPIE